MTATPGHTFAAPNADWLLLELPMLEMRKPAAYFSAFVETPWNALEGVTPDDPLPINGVAWAQGNVSDYVDNPIIAFPPVDAINVATVNEEKKIFSLLVDLQNFPLDSIVRIGLYGFVQTYYITAGLGTDGPYLGSIFSSEFYGSVTKDYSSIAGGAWSPATLNGCPEKLYIVAAKSGGDQGRLDLISSFPELAAYAYAYRTDGQGQYEITAGFLNNGGTHLWNASGGSVIGTWGINAGSLASYSNPNLWKLRDQVTAWAFALPVAGAGAVPLTTSVNWVQADSGIIKTATMDCSIMQDATGTIASVPVPPDVGSPDCRVDNIFQVQYFVPTWKFTDDREVSVNVVAQTGLPLWTQQAKHITPRPDNSYTWETADYPTRPEFAEIGTAVISNADDAADDDSPANHFGHIRIGTLVVHRASGLIEFLPEIPAPVDGGPTGDGPDGDGTAPGRTANPELRAWTYSLDGHDYYCLRLGDTLSLVYDDYSEQWMDWTDFASLTWRAHCGVNWTGAQNLADTYGSSIVCGDDAYGLLWFLNPNQPYDEDPETGVPIYFSRVTAGQVPIKGREVLPCYATWLTTDMGAPAYYGSGVTLYTSDDAGVSWDMHDFILVTPGEASPELSWYSLGQVEAPGRLFKIFDNGAITRIDALEMNDPDDEKTED